MIAYIEKENEFEIMYFLKKYGYKRIISIYPKGNNIVCWYEN